MKWIRLWVDDSINGTTFTELNAANRGVWYTLLLLAGYSPKPGTICIAEGVAYTNQQLAAFTKLTLEEINSGIKHLSSESVGKITINKDGTISITNWLKYQTEYDRQKGYRRGLQGKVTHKSDTKNTKNLSVSVSTSVSILPKGLSQKTWDDFKEHRAHLKPPMTANAEARLLEKLAKMVAAGEDPEEVVGRSIENGWKGLFPSDRSNRTNGGTYVKPGKLQRAADAFRAHDAAHGSQTGVVKDVGT